MGCFDILVGGNCNSLRHGKRIRVIGAVHVTPLLHRPRLLLNANLLHHVCHNFIRLNTMMVFVRTKTQTWVLKLIYHLCMNEDTYLWFELILPNKKDRCTKGPMHSKNFMCLNNTSNILRHLHEIIQLATATTAGAIKQECVFKRRNIAI